MLWQDRSAERLTWWGELWRILLAFSLGAMFAMFVIWAQEDAGVRVPDGLVALDLMLGLLAVALMPLRRRWPLPTALILSAYTAFSAMAVAATAMVLISLATRRRRALIVVVGIAWLAAGIVFEMVRPSGGDRSFDLVASLIISLLGFGLSVMIGYNIGGQRMLQESWRVRAETAEREQASRMAQAQATERSRIAREMHDVLAHRISLIAMHAGALTYRTDLSAAETRQTAALIRDTSTEALSELREILGVLRSQETAIDAPQPTLAEIGALLARERDAGAEVEADIAIASIEGIPNALSRNAFRITQELLTNARKHSADATVHLTIRGAPGEGISITCRNARLVTTPTPPSSGLGLAGITERAMLAGGELRFGENRNGEFVVHAQLPWPA